MSASVTHHPNGSGGLSCFPVTSTISYVIRDNSMCCDSMVHSPMPFDVFVIVGRNPTVWVHNHCLFMHGAYTYIEACRLVEEAIERVEEGNRKLDRS